MLIGVDWGGSSLRVFRFDDLGGVSERRSSRRGVAAIENGRFAEALGELIADWATSGDVRVIMCGMVGSRQGWAEADYIACPTDLRALAARLLPLDTPFGPALIAPGLSVDDDGRLDVMRGEELNFWAPCRAMAGAASSSTPAPTPNGRSSSPAGSPASAPG